MSLLVEFALLCLCDCCRHIVAPDEIEQKVQGGLSPRPLLSVPHILADESNYYHG